MPPRGSAQDRLLEEVHRRNRAERFTVVELFARILGEGLGMRSTALETMLQAYREELSQVKYTPAYAANLRQRKVVGSAKKAKKKLNDEALLKKLEGLTAPEDEPPQKKAGARRR